MFKSQKLRALVNERLTAAAEEIFALFERTLAEYEEELCRCNEENQQLQSTRVLLHREGSRLPSPNPDPSLNQEITETQIKEEPEEQSDKEEEELLLVSVPGSSGVYVTKKEKSSHFLRGQSEHRKETQGEETHFHSETEGDTEDSYDTDNDWEPQSNCLDEQMETEANAVHCNRVQVRDRSIQLSTQSKSGPEKSALNNGDMSGTDRGTERNKHQCSVCQPYSCSTCKKTFAKKTNLVVHRRTHTGEKAYNCTLCEKSYSSKDCLKAHMRTHTGESLHSCSLCGKSFPKKSHLDIHMRSHTGEKPYSCLFCDKAFSVNSNLTRHLRTHQEEKQ